MNYEDYIKSISLNIRKFREEKKLTIQEVAHRCNMERSNLSRIEAGKSNLTIKTMCQISEAIGVSFEKLVSGTGENKENDHPLIDK